MSKRSEDPKCVSCEEAKIKAEENRSNAVAAGYVHSECQDLYSDVERCMKKHKGKISPCQEEWKKFQECHLGTKEKRLNVA